MELILFENCFFSYLEFYFILALIGIKDWYGLKYNFNYDILNKSKYNEIIVRLYQKNVIKFDNNKVILVQEFLDLFSAMKNSKICVYAKKMESTYPAEITYFSENYAITIKQSICNVDNISIGAEKVQDWKEKIIRSEYFPEYIYAEKIVKDEMPGIKEELSNENILEYGIISVLEKRKTANGELLCRMIIQEKGLFGQVCIQEKNGNQNCLVIKENEFDLLDKFLKLYGGRNDFS